MHSRALLLALAAALATLAPAATRAPASAPGPDSPLAQRGQKGRQGGKPSARQKKTQKRRAAPKKRAPSRSRGPGLYQPSATGELIAPELPGDADSAAVRALTADLEEVPPEFRIATDAEIQEWFQGADHDQDGWISFRESAAAMSFDRPRFAIYDSDRDGRFQYPEFKLFYFDSLRRLGRFSPPRPAPEPAQPPPRDADQLRNAYDADLDEHVDAFELETVLRDYAREDLTAPKIMSVEDADQDGRLSLSELEGLVALLYPVALGDGPVLEGEDAAGSLLELFRNVIPRGSPRTGTPSPPLVTGPVPQFARLDLDNDGAISIEDLRTLLRPVPESVRLSSVLNSLDLDGDGVLNPHELVSALVPERDR